MVDEMVFLARRRGNSDTYHTDRDCHLLNKSNTILEKAHGDLPDDYNECRQCAGDDFRAKTGGSALRDAVAELDPEDVGLSPMVSDRPRF